MRYIDVRIDNATRELEYIESELEIVAESLKRAQRAGNSVSKQFLEQRFEELQEKFLNTEDLLISLIEEVRAMDQD